MSRIGKKPIVLPKDVVVTISEGNQVVVKGPLGTLERKLPTEMNLKLENNELIVERPSDLKMMKSLHGLTRTLLANMVEGVDKGYSKELQINGVGYKASKQGTKLVLALGYSHPVELEDPDGVLSEVPEATKIIIKGIDKEKVGQFAAIIRSKREPEPYKGKGIKYANEVIRRKEGKSGKK
ncbi:MAG TPA: 50S ribosomal protein L6 [Clostridiales bacterium]|nr:MAG: 50S ribosomal protein L6 [Clostridiales bacterium GWD2_32_19]HCC07394.1 50S ribosomal protein L6 [Clostridiales bacterium]